MSPSAARTRPRRTLPATVGVLVAVVLVVVTLASTGGAEHRWASLLVTSAGEVLRSGHRSPLAPTDGAAGLADGVLPDGVTVFDDRYPGVAELDPDLLRALRAAAADAAGHTATRPTLPHHDGVFILNSGWRSPEYQAQLHRAAIATYGSEEEAARWVATPTTSPHVSGDGVDLGPSWATAWLSEHGARYGLCQIYRNEPWHYELRAEAVDHGCPAMYGDPTQDPRMHR